MPTKSHPRFAALALLLAGALALGAAAPSIAGVVYVVSTSDETIDGVLQQTEVLASNTLSDPAVIGVNFIASHRDGTDRPADFSFDEFTIQPGRTMILRGLTGGERHGMLEVSAPSGVSIAARLVSSVDGGPNDYTSVPVVGSNELLRGGTFHSIEGLMRDDTRRTSFGIANLSTSVNDCLAQTWNANGTAIIANTSLAVEPLSTMYFRDAVLASGVQQASDARIQVVCSRDAYSFGVVRDIETGDTTALWPSVDGGSALRAPGATFQCPPSDFCFERQGTVLVPSRSNPLVFFDMAPPNANYGSMRITFKVQNNGWFSQDPAGFHSLFWIFRDLRWLETLAYVNVRGPNRNLVVNNSLLNDSRVSAPFVMDIGETYEVDFLYDARNRTSRLVLTDSTGAVVLDLVGRILSNTIEVQSGFRFEFGLEVGPVEVPSYGWVYSDLLIVFSP